MSASLADQINLALVTWTIWSQLKFWYLIDRLLLGQGFNEDGEMINYWLSNVTALILTSAHHIFGLSCFPISIQTGCNYTWQKVALIDKKFKCLSCWMFSANFVANMIVLCYQVDKLKVLAESLANSTVKAEKRISDHRCYEHLMH